MHIINLTDTSLIIAHYLLPLEKSENLEDFMSYVRLRGG